jgi:hypothetical protein
MHWVNCDLDYRAADFVNLTGNIDQPALTALILFVFCLFSGATGFQCPLMMAMQQT